MKAVFVMGFFCVAVGGVFFEGVVLGLDPKLYRHTVDMVNTTNNTNF